MKKMSIVGTTFLLGFLLLVISSCGQGPPKKSLEAQAQLGKVHFRNTVVAVTESMGKELHSMLLIPNQPI